MKIHSKLFLLFAAIIFILSCNESKNLLDVKLQFFDDNISFIPFKPLTEVPAINSKGELIGISVMRKRNYINSPISNTLWARPYNINLTNGNKVETSLLNKTFICEDINRILTIGSSEPDHHFHENPYIIFYDLKGQIITQLDTELFGEYKFKVSEKGDIYITGFSNYNNPKKVLLKLNKDGEKVWVFNINGNQQVLDLALSPNNEKISVSLKNSENKNQITTLTSEGNMTHRNQTLLPTYNFDFLGNDKFIFSHGSRFFIGGEKNLDTLYASDEISASRIICTSAPNGKSFAILSGSGEVKVYSLNSSNEVKLFKKTDVEEFEKFDFNDLRSFIIKNDNSVEICTDRIYFKLFNKSS